MAYDAVVSPLLQQGELGERYSVASESGSSTDSHAEALEAKDGERSTSSSSHGLHGDWGFSLSSSHCGVFGLL